MNKIYPIQTLLLLLLCTFCFGQNNVAINTTGTPPDSSAILDIQSDSKGLLVPRMSSVNRINISSPATGLIVYDLDENHFFCFAGNEWVEVMAGFTTLLSDKDDDTKIEVEQSPDEDIIHFQTEGIERWKMINSRLESHNTGGSIFIGENAGLIDDLSDHANIGIGRGTLENNIDHQDLVAIGDSALFNNGNGNDSWVYAHSNTAVGSKSMLHNHLGHSNTAVGLKSMYLSNNGDYNVGVGEHSLFHNDGDFNSAVGAYALYTNDDGRFNVAMGWDALYDNIDADRNTAIGAYSMKSNTTGENNTSVGYASLNKNTEGYENSALGYTALFFNETGDKNTANGQGALYSNLSGNLNTAVGSESLRSNETGHSNTAVGEKSLYSNSTGNANTAVGMHSLYHNNSHSDLVAVGDSALFNNGLNANSSWQAVHNTAIGSNAMFSNTTGYSNTSVGGKSLFSNISGKRNTSSGYEAMYSNKDGFNNTASGYQALFSDTSGSNNVAFGYHALHSLLDAYNNTAIGSYALFKDSSGHSNTAVGRSSLYQNKSGVTNIGIGGKALYYNVTGDKNVAVGYSAGSGSSLHSKSGGVFVGNYAGYNETSDNRLYIDNSSTADPLLYGEFDNNILTVHGNLGIGTKTPISTLQIEGGDDTDLVSGGFIMLGGAAGRSIAIDDNEIQARDDSLASILYLQAEGGDFAVHHPANESTHLVVKNDGKTGIGVADPSDKMHVRAESGINPFRVQLDGITKFRIHDSGGISFLSNYDPGADAIRVETGLGDLLIESGVFGPNVRPTIDVAGNVGLSNFRFNNMYALTFHGTLQSSSDARLKENVRPIDQPTKILNALKGVTYAFKKDHFYNGREEKDEYRRTNQLGLIAQDVEKLLPQLVHSNVETGMKSVEYIGLIPILIEAVKEQQTVIDLLSAENAKTQRQIDELKNAVMKFKE